MTLFQILKKKFIGHINLPTIPFYKNNFYSFSDHSLYTKVQNHHKIYQKYQNLHLIYPKKLQIKCSISCLLNGLLDSLRCKKFSYFFYGGWVFLLALSYRSSPFTVLLSLSNIHTMKTLI